MPETMIMKSSNGIDVSTYHDDDGIAVIKCVFHNYDVKGHHVTTTVSYKGGADLTNGTVVTVVIYPPHMNTRCSADERVRPTVQPLSNIRSIDSTITSATKNS